MIPPRIMGKKWKEEEEEEEEDPIYVSFILWYLKKSWEKMKMKLK
jgi:hypothetical protein